MSFAALGNTPFIGYPVVEAILGHDALHCAVIAGQGGLFPTFIAGGYMDATLNAAPRS